MLGDYLTALLIAVLGYVYPAYLCFKVRLASRPPQAARCHDFFPLNSPPRGARGTRVLTAFLRVSPSPNDPRPVPRRRWRSTSVSLRRYAAGASTGRSWRCTPPGRRFRIGSCFGCPCTRGEGGVRSVPVAPAHAGRAVRVRRVRRAVPGEARDRHRQAHRRNEGERRRCHCAPRARRRRVCAREVWRRRSRRCRRGRAEGQAAGFGARSATEAAAMAYARGPKQN